MVPAPDAGQADPADAEHVQVTEAGMAGGLSPTVAPTTGEGPTFVTTIVYVTGWPGWTVVTPSVFVIPRSACGTTVPEAASAQKPECSPYVPPSAGPPASG